MSVVTSSLFSGMKGSLGNIIVYEVNGQMRMRAKPGPYKKSKSESLMAQRNKFKAAAKFFFKLGKPMSYSWDEATRGKTMSGYNLFIKENIHNFTATGEISGYTNLKISIGPLEAPEEIGMQYTAPNLITLKWNPEAVQNGSKQDQLQVVIYAPLKKAGSKFFWVEAAEASRSAGECTFAIPPKAGEELHIFAFFKDKFLNIYSDSRYIGTLERNIK